MGSYEGSTNNTNNRDGNGKGKHPPTIAIRYGRMGYVGEFTHNPKMTFASGRPVVVSTDRGIEIGDPLNLTCQSCPESVSREQMQEYARSSGSDTYQFRRGRVLREATESDLSELGHIETGVVQKIERCREFVQQLGLEMKIVDCEHVFGGERIVFYFMSDHRVDFRELVRMLAHEFQTRIEMKQVGARDEARLLADYETCGRQCCCKNFLKNLKPITMQMAKIQKATLDPSKVSGRCGRLKCCLRYEHESYETLDRRLPKSGIRVATNCGTGRVVDRQILTQLLKVHTDEGKIIVVSAEDILEVNVPEPPEPPSSTVEQDKNRGNPTPPVVLDKPKAQEPTPALTEDSTLLAPASDPLVDHEGEEQETSDAEAKPSAVPPDKQTADPQNRSGRRSRRRPRGRGRREAWLPPRRRRSAPRRARPR